MTTTTIRRLRLAPALLALLLVAWLAAPHADRPQHRPPITLAAATPLTVSQALAAQDGATRTVRGYVVGQPTATSTVVTSGFPNDYALALADTAGSRDTSAMVYVQIPSAFRAAYGLRSNPGLMGSRIDVTGPLTAYFSHPGVRPASAFAAAGGGSTGGGAGAADTRYDSTYYRDAVGRTGASLKASLHQAVSTGTRSFSYSQVWAALRETDEDPADASRVIELYTGASVPETSNGGNPDDWNREHVWAKSHGDFGTATGPGTDLHHLRPTDVSVNGARGNLDFDEGGSGVFQCGGCAADANSFEPPDRVKGDVARMVLYMAVRYEGGDGWPDLEPNDLVGNGSAPRLGRVSVLLRWNDEDPPDAFERRRNDVVFDDWQRNRNPFVDHPEWARSVFG